MRTRKQTINDLIEASDFKDSEIALNSDFIRDLFNDAVGQLKDATKIVADNKRHRAHIKKLKANIQQLEEYISDLLEKVDQFEEDIKNIREGNPVGAVALVGRELLARFQAQIPRWISVEERLPEEGCWVLCWYKRWDNSSWHTVGRINPFDGGWELDVGHGLENKNKVTHWMPLPEPPKEEKP